MSTDWSMPRRAEQCAACGHPFEVGEAFQAFLYEGEAGYERRDYCRACEVPAEPAPIGSWLTRRPEPVARKVQPFDREAIFSFFERLEDAKEPHQIQFRFVLALLLWRKKVLRLDGTRESEAGESWEFVVPRTGAAHQVLRPPLDEEQLEQLSNQLEGLLAGQPGDLEIVASDLNPEEADD